VQNVALNGVQLTDHDCYVLLVVEYIRQLLYAHHHTLAGEQLAVPAPIWEQLLLIDL
jgi:hypothetical protein